MSDDQARPLAPMEEIEVIKDIERTLGAEQDERRGGFDWIKSMPVAISVAGIVLYGVITIADERFYEALGVTGSDVGLSYANTLVRASGLVIIFGVLVAVLILLFVWPRQSRKSGADAEAIVRAKDNPHLRMILLQERLLRKQEVAFRKTLRLRTYILSGVFVVLLLAAALPALYIIAADRATLVAHGHSVGPVRFAGLTILPISADPASVQWVSPNRAPVLPQHLLYLGQAGGLTPLYNPALKQVLWLPSNLITVRASH